METVKIHTKKGRIITLTILQETDTHLSGRDKFNEPVILPKEDIYSMFPIEIKVK